MKKQPPAAPMESAAAAAAPPVTETAPAPVQPRADKLIIFMQGGKGGTGKTTFALQLLDHYEREGVKPHVIDFDNENRAGAGLDHFWPNTVKVNINRRNALDAFVAGAESSASIIFADMGAGAGETALEWINDMEPALREVNIAFASVGIVTEDTASIESVLAWGQALEDRVRHIIVLNEAGDPRSEFTRWHTFGNAQAYRDAASPAVIRMESIDPVMQGLMRISGDTLGAVAEGRAKDPALNRMLYAMRAKGLRSRMDAELKRIGHLLLP